MERNPFSPSESAENPDKTGEDDAPKKNEKSKKKRTTKIPLPVTKSEAKEDKIAPEQEKKTSLEDLFVSKDETEEPKQSDEVKTPAEPEALEQNVNPETEVSIDTAEAELAESQVENPVFNLEGEFAEEAPIIITKAEKTAEQAVESAPTDIPRIESNKPAEPESPSATTEAVAEPESSSIEPQLEDGTQEIEPEPEVPETYQTIHPEEREISDSGTPVVETFQKRPSVKNEQMVSREEMEREVYYAKKRGVSRGVLAGGITGWFIGRRGKKAVEKEAQAAINERDKEISSLKSDQVVSGERLGKLERAKVDLSWRLEKSRQESKEYVAPRSVTESRLPQGGERYRPNYERQAEAKIEEAPEDQPITEEAYRAPEGRRVETSAWHRVEIDEKTGRVVENPQVEYGREFQKEQRQEKLQREAVQQQAAAQLGQTILTGIDGVEELAKDDAREPIKPTKKKHKPQATIIKQQFVQYSTNPLIWIAAALLVVILFVIGILR